MDKYVKARRTLRKAIKHWMLDIVKPFKDGHYIYIEETMKWVHTQEEVKSGADHCPLCQIYEGCISDDGESVFYDSSKMKDEIIDEVDYVCPLFLTQRNVCGPETAWSKFVENPCLETAEAMVAKLVESYNKYV